MNQTMLDRLLARHLCQSEQGGAGQNGAVSLGGNAPGNTPAESSEPMLNTDGGFVLPGEDNQMVTSTATPPPMPTEVPETQGDMSLVWIIAALAVVAIAALLVVLLQRKGKNAAPKGIPAEPTTAANFDMQETATVQMVPPTIKVGHAQHIGRRSDQQDSYGITSLSDAPMKGLLAVVADGMGGMSDGALISRTAVQTIMGGFQSLPVEKNPPLHLVRLACGAHKAIKQLPSAGQGGSTLLMAYVFDEWLFTLSIGDSRMYLMRDHTLMQLNREHTYSVELDERAALGEITLEQALNDPQRKALTSYLGIDDLQKIDRTIRPFPLRRGDRIALMSDGVFGTISDSEIQMLLELPPQQAAQQIQEAVLLKNQPRQDNLTVVVVAYE